MASVVIYGQIMVAVFETAGGPAYTVNTQELQKIVNGAWQKWLRRKCDLRINVLVRATYSRAKEELERKRLSRKRRWQELWSESAQWKRPHQDGGSSDDDPLSLNCFFEKLRHGQVAVQDWVWAWRRFLSVFAVPTTTTRPHGATTRLDVGVRWKGVSHRWSH